MAEIKKYLDTTALGTLVDQIKAEDAKVLAAANKAAEDLGKNYDTAGAAATAESNAKAYTDTLANGAVKANTEAIAKLNGDATTDGSVAKAVADAKTAIDADIDAVETVANKNAEDIAAINHAETGILAQAKAHTNTEVEKVQGEVDALEEVVQNIQKNAYDDTEVRGLISGLEAGKADKTQLAADKTELNDLITAEAATARAAEKANADAIKAIQEDYLKATDKTELQGEIAAVAEDVAEITGDYLKAADKTELVNAVTAEADRAKGIEAGLRTDIDTVKADHLKAVDKTELSNAIVAEAERAAGVEESLQTQINTIMNNPDAEGAINSINEFTQYIADHGEIADGFRADINANAKAISDHETLAAQTYETKEDATTKYDELTELVNGKAVQADWNQNDETAADYVKNRTHYEGENRVTIWSDVTVTTDSTLSYAGANHYRGQVSSDYYFAVNDYPEYTIVVNGVEYKNMTPHDEALGAVSNNAGTIDFATCPVMISKGNMGSMRVYSANPSETFTISIYAVSSTLKQLDEKFIPDTIARVSDVEAMETEIQGKLDAKADATALTSAVESLEGADAAQIERIAALEEKFGEGEGSVADMVADAKQEAIDAAVEAAATDAAAKDAVVLSEAQKYVDGEIDKVEERVAGLETASATHALASDLTALAGRVTTAEGEIDTLQSDMDAVEALAAANKAAHEANAAAIALKASQADLEAAVARIAQNETDIEALEGAVAAKAEQDDLDAAVERIAKNETDIAANTSAINSFTPITSDEVNALFA